MVFWGDFSADRLPKFPIQKARPGHIELRQKRGVHAILKEEEQGLLVSGKYTADEKHNGLRSHIGLISHIVLSCSYA